MKVSANPNKWLSRLHRLLSWLSTRWSLRDGCCRSTPHRGSPAFYQRVIFLKLFLLVKFKFHVISSFQWRRIPNHNQPAHNCCQNSSHRQLSSIKPNLRLNRRSDKKRKKVSRFIFLNYSFADRESFCRWEEGTRQAMEAHEAWVLLVWRGRSWIWRLHNLRARATVSFWIEPADSLIKFWTFVLGTRMLRATSSRTNSAICQLSSNTNEGFSPLSTTTKSSFRSLLMTSFFPTHSSIRTFSPNTL